MGAILKKLGVDYCRHKLIEEMAELTIALTNDSHTFGDVEKAKKVEEEMGHVLVFIEVLQDAYDIMQIEESKQERTKRLILK